MYVRNHNSQEKAASERHRIVVLFGGESDRKHHNELSRHLIWTSERILMVDIEKTDPKGTYK